MTTVLYDATFAGWLTAVFEVYQQNLEDVVFAKNDASDGRLFGTTHVVITDDTKAQRVWNGLQKRLSPEGVKSVYNAFLSEVAQTEELLLSYIRHVFASPHNIEQDYSHRAVWTVRQAAKRVQREAHRMTAFVRFKLTQDQLYYALIEPQCDVLPLIADHFQTRYADQRWLIYDARRKYGIYYDLETVTPVTVDFQAGPATSTSIAEIIDEREEFYQELWRRYFNNVTIAARKNRRLQLTHMPKRYWKHLTEFNKVP